MTRLSTAFMAAGLLSLPWSAGAAQTQGQPNGLTVELVRAMDADRNGQITQEEFLAQSSDDALWTELDTNADGVLDVEEIRAGIRVPMRTVR